MKDRLVIIGASYLQIPLVEKAKEMGLETHVFAWKEGAVCQSIADFFYPISITNIIEILNKCKLIEPRGIISIASDLAMVAVNTIAQELGLISNSIECTKLTTNKFFMRSKLFEVGIEGPKFIKISEGKLNDEIHEMEFPLIVKPVDRSGSRGVNLINNINEIEKAINDAKQESWNGDVIVEEFINGRELSIETISWEGKHYILQYTDKETTDAPNFIEKAHHQPAIINNKERDEIDKLVIKALDALNIRYGASHIELKIDSEDKLKIIEIGARMGGDCIGSDLVQLSTGYDFVKGVIEIATGNFKIPAFGEKNCSGIYYIFPRPGVYEGFIFKKNADIVKYEILAHISDYIPEIKDSSQRPAYYIYKSDHRIEFDPEQLILITRCKYDNSF